jgi:hypothetical protein
MLPCGAHDRTRAHRVDEGRTAKFGLCTGCHTGQSILGLAWDDAVTRGTVKPQR